MGTMKLDRREWAAFFNAVAAAVTNKVVMAEVVAPDIGAQFSAEGVGLIGISYDPKDRILDVALDGLKHRIPDPRELYVDMTEDGLVALEAVDQNGRKHILRLRSRLALPRT